MRDCLLFEMAVESMVEFAYQYASGGKLYELKVPIQLPHNGEAKELAVRIMNGHDIPCYFEGELAEQLESFIKREMEKWRDSAADEVIHVAMEEHGVSASGFVGKETS